MLTMVALLILYRFHSTSQDLISDGLYARVAVAFHTGQHRTVSLCLLAQEIIKHTPKLHADKVVEEIEDRVLAHASRLAHCTMLGPPTQ